MPISPLVARSRIRPAPRRSRPAALALRIPGRLLVLVAWSTLAWGLVAGQPPLRGSVAAVVLTAALLWRYVLRSAGGRRRERATLRLRGPGGALPWIGAAIPVWVVFNLSMARAQTRWSGPPPDIAGPIEAAAAYPAGWLPLLLVALLFTPLLEELFFRGFIQRSLERRIGTTGGILLGAALFAAYHCEPWRLGYLFAGGIVLGAFVHAARSLWAGVALHASANGSLALLHTQVGEPLGGAFGGGVSPAADALILSGSLALLVLLHARVLRSARPAPGRFRTRGPVPRTPIPAPLG